MASEVSVYALNIYALIKLIYSHLVYLLLKQPTLQTRRREHRLTMLYAIIHNLTIINPEDLLHRPHYYGRWDNTEKIRKIPGHSEAHRRTFFPATVDLWNSLPQDMVSSRNIETFKNKLRTDRPLLQCTHQTF